jgi:pyrrolidone-carboxylate peptidase
LHLEAFLLAKKVPSYACAVVALPSSEIAKEVVAALEYPARFHAVNEIVNTCLERKFIIALGCLV